MPPTPNTSLLNDHTNQQQRILSTTERMWEALWLFLRSLQGRFFNLPSIYGWRIRGSVYLGDFSPKVGRSRDTIWIQILLIPEPAFLIILLNSLSLYQNKNGIKLLHDKSFSDDITEPWHFLLHVYPRKNFPFSFSVNANFQLTKIQGWSTNPLVEK